MSLFILPDYMLESERTQQLLSFMESDTQHFYDYMDWLYRYISVDEPTSDYIDDAGKFIGLETLKFKYTEENKSKTIRNLFSLIKYLGSSKAVRIILMTYSLDIELKYLWTNDFITYEEKDITDIIYPYGKKHYLSSYMLNRIRLIKTIIEEFDDPPINLLDSINLDDHLNYYKSSFSRLYEEIVEDETRGQVYKTKRGSYQKSIHLADLDNDLGSGCQDYRMSIDVNSNVDCQGKAQFLGDSEILRYPIFVGAENSNILLNPDDLTQSNWIKTQAVVELSNNRILGHVLSKIQSTGSGCVVSDEIENVEIDGYGGLQFKIKKGNVDIYKVKICWAPFPTTYTEIQVTFSTKDVVVDNGTIINIDWVKDDEVYVQWRWSSFVLTEFYKIEIFYGLQNGEYGYIGALQVEKEYPRIYLGPKGDPVGSGVTTFAKIKEMPIKFFIRVVVNTLFKYDTEVNQTVFSWGDGTNGLHLFYDKTSHTFDLTWVNGYDVRILQSNSFGSELNEGFITIDMAVDLEGSPPDQNGGKLWINKVLKAGAWSGVPDDYGSGLNNVVIGGVFGSGIVGNYIIESITVYEYTDSQFDVDTDLIYKLIIFSYPQKSYCDWVDIELGNWNKFEKYIHMDPGFHIYGTLWEFRKKSGIFSENDYLKLTEPKVNAVDKFFMTNDLYSNVKADMNRMKMVQQVFLYECKLDIEINSEPSGWKQVFGDVWIWVNGEVSLATYKSDSGLKSDEGRISDATVVSILGEFDLVYFGSGATYSNSIIHDVENPIFVASGIVSVQESERIYDLLVYCDVQDFDFFNEIVVKNALNEVLFYVIMPRVEKTGDKIYIRIRMHYGGE